MARRRKGLEMSPDGSGTIEIPRPARPGVDRRAVGAMAVIAVVWAVAIVSAVLGAPGWVAQVMAAVIVVVFPVFIVGVAATLKQVEIDADAAEEWDDVLPEDRAEPVQPLRWWHLLLVSVLAAAVFGLLGYIALDRVPEWIASGGDHPPADTAQSLAVERGNLRTAALALIAAFGAALGLALTLHGHRHQAAEARRVENDRATSRQHARRSLTLERFNDAIQQLAEQDIEPDPRDQRMPPAVSRVTIRLAGVYSLGGVALESRQQRPAVRDVLTAFVADHQRWHHDHAAAAEDAFEHSTFDAEDQERWDAERKGRAAPPDIAAALVVLARIYGQQDLRAPKFALAYATLSGADLRDADLQGADLTGANLAGADLRGADLRDADLLNVVLSGADLRDADLTGARSTPASLAACKVEGAKVPEAWTAYLTASVDRDVVAAPS